ncbi:MAG: hypothetical protein IPP74_12470 [Alphaproteobacteria bacterium]|nr:hypothetical protein [Alphaproteobacteria bacterium]
MRITSHTTLVVGKPGKAESVLPGTAVDIDDDEAEDLIHRGLAVKVVKTKSKVSHIESPSDENVQQPSNEESAV